MSFRNLVRVAIVSAILVTGGCSSPESSNDKNAKPSPEVSSRPGKNNSKTESKPPVEVKTPAPRKEVNKAETLKPLVKAYCAAINSGDDKALKDVFSRASWKSLTADARKEGKPSVAKYLGDSEPIGATCEVINERIAGNLAEAIVTTETYPKGVPLKFIRENGSWRMTNQSSDFDAVRKASGK